MKKHPANRVELIGKSVVAKMLSLVLLESKTYEECLKECVIYFNKIYHKDPDKVYRILITEYQVAMFFCNYVANLKGFAKFLNNTENIKSIKSLKIEDMEKDNNFKTDIAFKKACFKGLKTFTKGGSSFEDAVAKIVLELPKSISSYKGITEEDVIYALASYCFNVIEEMAKEPLKYILNLVKLLNKSELNQLKSKI